MLSNCQFTNALAVHAFSSAFQWLDFIASLNIVQQLINALVAGQSRQEEKIQKTTEEFICEFLVLFICTRVKVFLGFLLHYLLQPCMRKPGNL